MPKNDGLAGYEEVRPDVETKEGLRRHSRTGHSKQTCEAETKDVRKDATRAPP